MAFEQPLLREAPSSKRCDASLTMVDSIATYFEPDSSAHGHIANIRRAITELSPNHAEQSIRLAIGCFDYLIADEIRAQEGSLPRPTDDAAVYFRSDVYRQHIPRIITDKVTSELHIKANTIVIATEGQRPTLDALEGQVGRLAGDLLYFASNSESFALPQPPIGVPRQELYRALLRCGINPIDTNSGGIMSYRQPAPYKEHLLGRVYANLAIDNAGLELRRDQIANHWGEILGKGDIPAVLFASGTASNESVMRAIAKASNGLAYFHPYWYYENTYNASTFFPEQTEEVTKSTSLFIGLEPTNFFNLDYRNPTPDFQHTVRDFLRNALANPHREYYITIDATADPLYDLSADFDLTKLTNLTVVKTVSATKHQDGGRNYFFGVAHTEDAETRAAIESEREISGGHLFESHLLHFPLPDTSWLAEKSAIVRGLNQQLTRLNGFGDWRMSANTYHTFIMPPDYIVRSLAKNMELIDISAREEAMVPLNLNILHCVRQAVRSMKQGSFELGDSFGLPQTRSNVQGGPNKAFGVSFRLKLPRISPGYTASTEDLLKFAENTLDNLAKITGAEQLSRILGAP